MRRSFTETPQMETMNRVNLTPLIDVTFFILIIFILIAPMIEHGINLNLPSASPSKMAEPKSVTVSVSRHGDSFRVYIDNRRVELDELEERLRALKEADPLVSIILRADRNLKYSIVVDTLDRITESGISRLGIATVPKK
ncbi:MAG: biopolymer transporter ExbD [Candidatus Tritonobacter lacicola]|nr:biopolymer transporter ExbD [Candidatus Tritonobacter lacicola]